MRISPIGDFGAALVFALATASIEPSEGVVLHPWCASGTGEESGALSCSYDTYEQCVANVGICQANPAGMSNVENAEHSPMNKSKDVSHNGDQGLCF